MKKTAAQLANMVLAKVANEFQDEEDIPDYTPEDRWHRAPLYGGLSGAVAGGLLGVPNALWGRFIANRVNHGSGGYGRSTLRGGAAGSAIGTLMGTALGAYLQHNNNKAVEEHLGLTGRQLDGLDALHKEMFVDNPEKYRNEKGELPTHADATFLSPR